MGNENVGLVLSDQYEDVMDCGERFQQFVSMKPLMGDIMDAVTRAHHESIQRFPAGSVTPHERALHTFPLAMYELISALSLHNIRSQVVRNQRVFIPDDSMLHLCSQLGYFSGEKKGEGFSLAKKGPQTTLKLAQQGLPLFGSLYEEMYDVPDEGIINNIFCIIGDLRQRYVPELDDVSYYLHCYLALPTELHKKNTYMACSQIQHIGRAELGTQPTVKKVIIEEQPVEVTPIITPLDFGIA
jgi:hypothetical protein